LSLAIACLAQSKRGPSTKEERDRVVAIAKTLEAQPLSKEVRKDREWLVLWLIEVPDVSVSVCTATLPYEKNYKYAGELISVSMASSAAFVVENPDKSKDSIAVAQAGLESLLRAYTNILAGNPGAHSKNLDKVLSIQAEGKLSDYVNTQWKKECKS
jgi:hypothetical protein